VPPPGNNQTTKAAAPTTNIAANRRLGRLKSVFRNEDW
jgi:hypothetical protein